VSADPRFLRTTFDDSPELYDRTRTVAPPEVFNELAALARLEPGSRVLEIGCGTGQATLPLADRGFDIVAIELGPDLAAFARAKLARFPRVRVVTTSFEEWDAEGERFDAVVAVNSFHWVDPEVQFAKPAEVLREDGALAIVGMAFVTPDDADPLLLELQQDYAVVLAEDARGAAPPHPRDVVDRAGEIEASGYFRDVAVRRHLVHRVFGADEYIDYLQTSSWHRRLDDDVRRELFGRISRRIDRHPSRTLRTTLLVTLYVARRA
jgi:SAM-dependent methyltransferase